MDKKIGKKVSPKFLEKRKRTRSCDYHIKRKKQTRLGDCHFEKISLVLEPFIFTLTPSKFFWKLNACVELTEHRTGNYRKENGVG